MPWPSLTYTRRAQVSCINPKVFVHAAKLKVDGITKYLDNTKFRFDHVSTSYMCHAQS